MSTALTHRRVATLLRAALAAALLPRPLPGAEDLWTERRRAVRATEAGPVALLDAVLPSARDAATSWLGAAEGAGAEGGERLPGWVRPAVGLDVDLRDLSLPAGAPLVVVHLQDIHDAEPAQRKIAAALSRLAAARRTPPPLVLEGAAGEFDVRALRALVEDVQRPRAADPLLRKNLLSGAEFFALTDAAAPRTVGAEDAALYRDNVAALRGALARREDDRKTVRALQDAVDRLGARAAPPALRALVDAVDAHERGALPLATYFETLTDGVPAEGLGIQSRRFRALLAAERAFPADRVAEERRLFAERLAPLLTEAEARRLAAVALDARLGRVPARRLHALLVSLAAAHGVSWAEFPRYAAYEASRAEAERIDGAALAAELDLRRAAIEAERAEDPAARDWSAAAEDVRLLRRAASLALSPSDAARFRARRAELARLPERLSAMGAAGAPARALDGFLARAGAFYDLAERRNEALAAAAWKAAREDAGGVAVLVAGGFHAPGVRDALRARGAGYIGLAPRLDALPAAGDPLEAFRPGSSPADRLWGAPRLALHRPLLTAPDVLDDAPGAPEKGRGALVSGLAAAALAVVAVDAHGAVPASGERVRPAAARDALRAAARRLESRAAEVAPPVDLTVFPDEVALTRGPSGGVRAHVPLAVSGRRGPSRRTAAVDVDAPGGAVTDIAFGVTPFEWRARLRDEWRRFVGLPVRQGLAVLRGSLVSPWSPGIDEWVARRLAALGTRGLWSVGQATGGVASFGLLELNRLARWTGWNGLARWTETVRTRLLLDEERRWVGLLNRSAPLGVQAPLFYRLAVAHGLPWESAWTTAVRDALPRLGPGVPPLALMSLEDRPAGPGDPGGVTARLRLDGRPVALELSASRAAALYERPVDHALAQVVWDRGGARARAAVQAPALAETAVLSSVLRHTAREWAALLRDPDLSLGAAHAAAREEGEDLRVGLLMERGRWIDALQTFENGLLSGALLDVRVDGGVLRRAAEGAGNPRDALRVRPVSPDRAIEQGRQGVFSDFGLSPYLMGRSAGGAPEMFEDVQRLAARLGALEVPEPRAWAERLAAVSLKEKFNALRLLARYFRAREASRRFFPVGSKRAPVQRALADFAVGLARSVGREAGQRAALEDGAVRRSAPGRLARARVRSAADRFPSLAATLLAAFEEAGVRPVPGREADRDAAAGDLLALYLHAFDEGYRRLTVLSSEDAAREADPERGLAVGVFHVRDSLRDSLAAGELARQLIERARRDELSTFAPVVLLDGPSLDGLTSAALSSELQYRLGVETPGATVDLRDAARRALSERLVLARAREFELEGRVSLQKFLGWTRTHWAGRTVGRVQIFTRDRDRLWDDARGRVADWVLYLIEPMGLRRLASAIEDAAAEERLRRYIATNA